MGIAVFAANGLLSVVHAIDQKKYDFVIGDDCGEITAMAFSRSGALVVGETRPNARFFLLKFAKGWDSIESRACFPTKENGFSCITYDDRGGW
jgi:hypothetical protein